MALPNSKILIHQVSGGFSGQATDIEIHAKEIIDVRQRLDEIISKHTGQPLDKVAKDTERDYFMSAAGGEGVQDRRPRDRAPLALPPQRRCLRRLAPFSWCSRAPACSPRSAADDAIVQKASVSPDARLHRLGRRRPDRFPA